MQRVEVHAIGTIHTPLRKIKPYAPCLDHLPRERSGWLDDATMGRTRADDRFEEKEP